MCKDLAALACMTNGAQIFIVTRNIADLLPTYADILTDRHDSAQFLPELPPRPIYWTYVSGTLPT